MEEGHLLARIRLDARGKSTDWRIEPGPTFQWRFLGSTGDSTYRPETLMRLGHLRRGDLATPSSLEHALERIRADGCTEIATSPRLTGLRGTTWADAWLPLEEHPCSQANLAMGWEPVHGFQGQGAVKLSNLLGTARTASLSASSRNGEQAFSLDWHEPWIGDWDLALDLNLQLQQSPTHQLQQGRLQGQWPAPLGTWDLGAQAWSSSLTLTDTTTTQSSAWGSRMGWHWSSTATKDWLHPERSTTLSVSTLKARGTPQPWLLESSLSASWGIPFPGFALAFRSDAQAILPLDSLSSAGAARSLGGSGDWKGHTEGQFPTSQWAVGELEGRFEAGGWGTALFFAPGAVWIWRAQGPAPHPGYGAGIGFHWAHGSSEARLDLAIGEETRDWQDALLHLTLRNRF